MAGNCEYKIVLLGGGGVGKSALTIRLVTDNFLDEYDPTIEDSWRKHVDIDSETVLLDILDTAGQEEFVSMQDQWMREGKGFLLVFNICSKSSFAEMEVLYEKILRAKDVDSVPLVIVGNKCDLRDPYDDSQVSQANAEELASRWNTKYFETSAKEEINNEECFYQVVREIRKREAAKNKGTQITPKSGVCTIL